MAFVPERAQLATRDEAIKIAEYYPGGAESRKLRLAKCTLCDRRLPDRKRAICGGTISHERRLTKHQNTENNSPSCHYDSRRSRRRGARYCAAAYEFR
jgi:hypothetical protein